MNSLIHLQSCWKRYATKADVYSMAKMLRQALGYGDREPIPRFAERCYNLRHLAVKMADITTPGVRGIAVRLASPYSDLIILDENRPPTIQNFDCAHELFHLIFHRSLQRIFDCNEFANAQQDSFIEWQANEAAAELLLPYTALLPYMYDNRHRFRARDGYASFLKDAAHHFEVSRQTVLLRIESLAYEYQQYYDGVALNDIRIVSRHRQRRRGMSVPSLNSLNGYGAEDLAPRYPISIWMDSDDVWLRSR